MILTSNNIFGFEGLPWMFVFGGILIGLKLGVICFIY